MSGTTDKKATQAAPAKTKKRSTRKKVAKTSVRKTRGSATGAKETAAKKKVVAKKAVAKKPATRKSAKRSASKGKTAPIQEKKTRNPKQTGTASTDSPSADAKSLSWMSAQAASALKAVKAHQAEKGHTILARTRKQATEKLDDDSLIEIAASMPVDNDSLIEFSAEETAEKQPRQIEAILSAPAPVEGDTSSNPDTSADSAVAAKPEVDLADEVVETPVAPAQQPEPGIQLPVPPPQPAKRSVLFHPALAAGILFSLLLGYYFWPDGDDTKVNENSATVATQESPVIETPAAVVEPDSIEPQVTTAAEVASAPAAEPEQESIETPAAVVEPDPIKPQVTTAAEVATAPTAEPEQEASESINERTPAGIPGTQEPSGHPQTAAVSPPAPEPKATPEPAPATPQPTVTQQAQPPAQPAAPAPAPAPAQRNYRAPVYGSYPQQRQQAYPQRYNRY